MREDPNKRKEIQIRKSIQKKSYLDWESGGEMGEEGEKEDDVDVDVDVGRNLE